MGRLYLTRNFFLSAIALLATIVINGCSKSGGSNPTPKATVTITSLSVTQGSYYTQVNITGTGFDPVNSQVLFNGKPATIYTGYSEQLTVFVPLAAGTGAVTVTTNSVTATGPVFTYVPALVASTLAGGIGAGYKDGPGSSALFNAPYGLAIDKNNNLYVTDRSGFLIRKVTPQGVVSTIAGSGKQGRVDGTTSTATFESPTGIALDQSGNIYVIDGGVLRKITPAGNVSTINVGATLVDLGITIDAANNVYLIPSDSNHILKMTPDGNITNIYLTATGSYADLVTANGMATDKSGNLFITDKYPVEKISFPANTISVFSLAPAVPTIGSQLGGIAVDAQGNVYFADTLNGWIRKITPDGTVTIFAGNLEYSGQQVDGIVNSAQFVFPTGVAVDASGNVFVTDGHELREISFQ